MNLPDTLLQLHRQRLEATQLPRWEAYRHARDAGDFWQAARELMPWKKGPFTVRGETLDGEWDCERKWARLSPHLGDLSGQTILDLGCNNGWYMAKLREAGAKRVVGLDPGIANYLQWELLQRERPAHGQEFYLLGVEHLPSLPRSFDSILSLGILYHHRDPFGQLRDLREALQPGGTLFLETIGIPGDGPMALLPPGPYAGMPNVYFLPSLPCLLGMLERSRFVDLQVLATSWDGSAEQRPTPWAPGPSYADVLDPRDPSRTVEGHPAPQRFLVRARRKGGT